MVEAVTVAWVADDHGLSREDLLRRLAGSLPAIALA